MEKDIFKMAASYGGFAVLFCYLLFYTLKENGKRENKYQDIITKLTDKFNIVEDVQKDVKEVKDYVFKNK
ncbi:BhlA/UviB family holin-like peptide (plasmid) [Haloimpatiens sp. FM7330]|uniref:BhlA/UviB family holin-like peptide n=1 Tax=Haloimpatiens sp. FM7330 TaxID=3298610 RepID=UPI003625DA3F